ncbi:MAG: hypothetical protein HY425_01090 [Candidatus Levybacteria bacterium]|nr:hypothetical protein [Candidatus Levybacteria bacterium]
MRKVFLFAFLFAVILSVSLVSSVSAQTPAQTSVIELTPTPTPVPLREGDKCDPEEFDENLGCPAGTKCASLDQPSLNQLSLNTTCIKESDLEAQASNGQALPCSKWAQFNLTEKKYIPIGASVLNLYRDKNGNLQIAKFHLKCIGVNTAIGNISTEPAGFVRSIFSLVLGLSGGIALILIILSGYKLTASQGNPEKITAARDQLISAIVGLLFIAVSFVLLQAIGVDILKIPGFKP